MDIQNKNSKTIFLIILLWYAIGNLIWWKFNTPIIPYDISALHFNDIFEDSCLFFNAPLITWIMKFMFYIFGKEYFDLLVIFVNYIFFVISLYYIYRLGVILKNKETGNIAMILFALVPAIYGMSRQYGGLEYHITSIIIFNIYCLIKTDYFKDRKWTIIYGISVGLGLLIKDEFLAYFFVPFLYIVLQSFRESITKTKTANILISISLGCLMAGSHYFREPIMNKALTDFLKNPVEFLFIFKNTHVMTIGLWENLLSPLIFIIFLIGLVWFFLKYKNKYKNLIFLWILVPWLGIMLMPHFKLAEYGSGFIPAMILIGALYLSHIKRKYIKTILLSLIIILGIFQYLWFSYAPGTDLFQLEYKYKKHSIKYFDLSYRNIIYNPLIGRHLKHLTNYLKLEYPNKTFYLFDRYNGNNQILYTLFRLNDIPYVYNLDYFEKPADMVISAYQKNAENVLIENYIAEDKALYEKILIIQEDINKNFQVIENITDRYFVKVLILKRIDANK